MIVGKLVYFVNKEDDLVLRVLGKLDDRLNLLFDFSNDAASCDNIGQRKFPDCVAFELVRNDAVVVCQFTGDVLYNFCLSSACGTD